MLDENPDRSMDEVAILSTYGSLMHVIKLPGKATCRLSNATPFKWGSGTAAFVLMLIILLHLLCLLSVLVCAETIVAKEGDKDDVSLESAFLFSLPIAFGLLGLSSEVPQFAPSSDIVTTVIIGSATLSFLYIRCLRYAIAFNLSASKSLSDTVITSLKWVCICAHLCENSDSEIGSHTGRCGFTRVHRRKLSTQRT